MAIIGLLIAVVIVASAIVPKFGTPITMYFLLLDVTPILLIALPMTMVITTGEIDLSVASMAGLSSVLFGVMFQAGLPIPLAIVLALVAGAAGGAINGLLVTVVGLPSLAVTIGTLALFRGLAVGLLGTTAITRFPRDWTQLAKAKIGTTDIPLVMILFWGSRWWPSWCCTSPRSGVASSPSDSAPTPPASRARGWPAPS